MGIIELKAQAIAGDMASQEHVKKYALDPFTVSTIISILVEVVKAVYACYQDHHQAAAVMADPGLIERWQLRRTIRDKVDDKEVHGVLGNKMFQSTLSVAKKTTPEEAEQMHNESQNL